MSSISNWLDYRRDPQIGYQLLKGCVDHIQCSNFKDVILKGMSV